jgi:hypothetical protein
MLIKANNSNKVAKYSSLPAVRVHTINLEGKVMLGFKFRYNNTISRALQSCNGLDYHDKSGLFVVDVNDSKSIGQAQLALN